MHHSGPSPPTFEGPEQDFGVKTGIMGVEETLDAVLHCKTILFHFKDSNFHHSEL